jgi:hypothetical protein
MDCYTKPSAPYRLQAYVTRRPNGPPRNPIGTPWVCDYTRPGER